MIILSGTTKWTDIKFMLEFTEWAVLRKPWSDQGISGRPDFAPSKPQYGIWWRNSMKEFSYKRNAFLGQQDESGGCLKSGGISSVRHKSSTLHKSQHLESIVSHQHEAEMNKQNYRKDWFTLDYWDLWLTVFPRILVLKGDLSTYVCPQTSTASTIRSRTGRCLICNRWSPTHVFSIKEVTAGRSKQISISLKRRVL